MEIVPRYKFEQMVVDALDDLPTNWSPCSTTWWSRSTTDTWTSPICSGCTRDTAHRAVRRRGA
ncbi:MAG: hypothetical protein R2697_12885 [Ilumatobacteraceae bacterium]